MKGVVLLLLVAGVAFPYVSGYHVEPVKAQWSGWTGRGDTVAQTITCNFDSLSYVELFAGDSGSGGLYSMTVKDGVSGAPVAHKYNVQQLRDHSWVRFDEPVIDGPFTKGKKYEFRFTRSGADSLHYYYDTACGYDYGQMIAPYGYGLLTTASMLVQAV